MTMKNVFIFLFLLSFFSCNEFPGGAEKNESQGSVRKLPPKMVYSYDCLNADSGKGSDIWGKADNILTKVTTFNIEVSDEEQMRFGDTFLIESRKDKNFVIDSLAPVNDKLRTILNNLVQARVHATGIQYSIYLLEDTATINAYTVGGKIFITTGMMKKCKNDDQLYAIIGHEMGHNEKGHIKTTLKQLKASNKFFGEWGEAFFSIKRLLTGSFNQKNELEADYYGLDLSWKLGYDICAIRSFWDEMAKGEEHEGAFDFFRTHPYSDIRSACLVDHIRKNFQVNCQ
jgi:predicted Zn-dependent protease